MKSQYAQVERSSLRRAPADHHAVIAAGGSSPSVGPARGLTLQARIDQSPLMLAQRRSIEAVFGGSIQRRSDASEAVEAAPAATGIPAQRRTDDAPASGDPGTAASANDTGMPDGLKAGMESLSGVDMSDVRVHRNSGKPAQLDALAYAHGSDIHLGPGQEEHLPHEAWHVVQQKLDKVRPTARLAGGMWLNDDPVLEQEATRMGSQAVTAGEGTVPSSPQPQGVPLVPASPRAATAPQAVQRVPHASNFEASLLDELTDANAAAPIGGLVAIPIVGAAPVALTGGVNAVLDAQFAAAIQAARRMDATASPRSAADALHPNAAAQVAIPGIGNVSTLMEMTDIRTFLVAISPGGVGIGAGQTPAGHDRSVVDWGSMHSEFGTFVHALLRRGGGSNGSSPSTAGATGIGGGNWALLHRRKKSPGVTLYARGHLLHAEMGGPGLDYNLVPLPNGPGYGANSANLAMAQYIEHTAKAAFFNMWSLAPTITAVDYTVGAYYTGHQRPMTTHVENISGAYADVNTSLQAMPVALGVAAPTHAQVLAAEAIPVAAFVPPCIYPGNLPGGAFPPNAIINNHAIVVAGTGAALGLAPLLAVTTASDAINAAATPHFNSAMAAMDALNQAGTSADTCEVNLHDNAALWREEDDIVPTRIQIIYNWVENGVATPFRQPHIDVHLPNSAAARFE